MTCSVLIVGKGAGLLGVDNFRVVPNIHFGAEIINFLSVIMSFCTERFNAVAFKGSFDYHVGYIGNENP